jgi:hypothetical protein
MRGEVMGSGAEPPLRHVAVEGMSEEVIVEQVKAVRSTTEGRRVEDGQSHMQSVEDRGVGFWPSTDNVGKGSDAREPAIEQGGGHGASGMAPQKPQKHVNRWLGLGSAFDGSEREELGGGLVLVGKQASAQLPPPWKLASQRTTSSGLLAFNPMNVAAVHSLRPRASHTASVPPLLSSHVCVRSRLSIY